MIFHHFKTSNSSLKWKRQRMITFTSKLCLLQQFPGVHSKMFSSSPCYIKVYLLQFPNCNLFLLLFHSSIASSQNLLTLLALFSIFSLCPVSPFTLPVISILFYLQSLSSSFANNYVLTCGSEQGRQWSLPFPSILSQGLHLIHVFINSSIRIMCLKCKNEKIDNNTPKTSV